MNANTKKYIIIICSSVLAAVLLFGTGWLCGRNRRISGLTDTAGGVTDTAADAADRTAELEQQLADRIAEVERLQSELSDISAGLDDAQRLAEQSGRLTDSIGTAVSDITATSTNALDIIKRLKDNQQSIRSLTEQLQAANTELTDKLGKLQESASQQ